MAETVPPAPDPQPEAGPPPAKTPTPEKPLGEGGTTPPTPQTPQGEGVPAPQVPPPSGPPSTSPEEPKKPESEGPSPTSSGGTPPAKKLFIWFVSIILGLLGVFYVLLMWGLLGGNLDNPLFGMLGMEPQELKDTLLLVTNSILGLVSLIFLIATLVKFFQWVMTPSAAADKKYHLKRTGGFFLLLLFMVGIWIGLFWLISNADVRPRPKKGEVSMILTDPPNVIGLTAPVMVKFDIGQKLYEKIDPELIRQINWDFDGDGEFDASGAEVIHRFLDKGENNGRFPVQVEIYYFVPGAREEKLFTDRREVIIANEAVLAEFSAIPESGDVPLTVRFSAAGSHDPDGAIILFEWDLDDDGEYEIRGEDEVEVEKVFSKIGEYTVRLRVTGQNNDFAVMEKVISVGAPAETLRAEISSPDSAFEGLAPLTITFDGSQSFVKQGQIVKFEWLIEGEDRTTIGRKIERTFDKSGEYKVTLTVEDGEGERDQVTQVVRVYDRFEVVINTSPPGGEDDVVRGKIPFDVTFDASSSEIPGAVEWRWDFESDGIVDDFSEKAQHTFRTAGAYEVKLVIVDTEEREHEKIQLVVVDPVGVVAKISANPTSGSVPLKVEFDGSGSSSSEGEIIDYIWEFPGEEPIHYSANILYEFRRVGVFPVKLTILTSDGGRAETEMFISVRVQTLKAEFDASPKAGSAPLQVVFNPLESTGSIREYIWDFGDGKTSRNIMPTHTFNLAGTYTVRLKVIDFRGVIAEVTQEIAVTE